MPTGKHVVIRGLALVGGLTLLSIPVLWLSRKPLLEAGLKRALGNASIELNSVGIDTFDSSEVSLSKLRASAGPHSVSVGNLTAKLADNPLDGFQKVTVSEVALLWDPFAGPLPTKDAPSAAPTAPIPFKEVKMSGTLKVGAESEAPVLTWSSDFRPGDKAQTLLGNARAAGLNSEINLQAQADFSSNTLAVQVPSFALELSSWYPWLTSKIPDLTALGSVSGKVSGGGMVTIRDGGRTGELSLNLQNLGATFPSVDLVMSGVSGALRVVNLDTFETAPGQVFQIDSARIGERLFANLHVSLHGLDRTHLLVETFACETLGGQVKASNIPVNVLEKSASGSVEVFHLDLAEIGKLFPNSKFKFTGRVSGKVPLSFDSQGLHLGRGWLELDQETPATVEFNQPGLITGSTPSNSPAYPVLKKVEDGLLSLRVKKLRVELYPSVEETQRSATLQIEAEPLDPGVKAPVFLDLNINGPVAKLINWGTNSNLNFSTDHSH